jgi:predicted nucleotidyltransferase
MAYNLNMVKEARFQISPEDQRRPIPMKTIRRIAQHIAQKFNPEQIILFGSHAYGKPTPESDVDLLVVMDSPIDEIEAMVEIAKSFPILTFGVDVIVRSRRTLERRKKLGDWFLREVTEKGKVLYERTDQRMGG